MKETESPIEPIAEAVRGLARDRTYLIEVREAYIQSEGKADVQPEDVKKALDRYYADIGSYNDQIAAIDKRIDELVLLDIKNVRQVQVTQ